MSPTRHQQQQTRSVEPVLVYCWASAVAGEPNLYESWVNVSCSLGEGVVVTGYL